MKDYEEKAVSLALNRTKLQDLTNRLKAARLTCPLFDTARWVSDVTYSFSYESAMDAQIVLSSFFLFLFPGEEFGAFLFQDVESLLLRSTSPALQSD